MSDKVPLTADTKTHTQGPWKAVMVPDEGRLRVLAGKLIITDLFLGWTDKVDQEQAANGRLIAAAPELLAALDGLYTEIADYIQCNNLGAMDNQSMRLARAAIAKATQP